MLLTTGYAEASIERVDARGAEFELISKPYRRTELAAKVFDRAGVVLALDIERAGLTTAGQPHRPPPGADAAQRAHMLDLAVAVIIGAAFGTITTSLTEDLIMPVVGAITVLTRTSGRWSSPSSSEMKIDWWRLPPSMRRKPLASAMAAPSTAPASSRWGSASRSAPTRRTPTAPASAAC